MMKSLNDQSERIENCRMLVTTSPMNKEIKPKSVKDKAKKGK